MSANPKWKEELAAAILFEAERMNVREMIEPMCAGYSPDGTLMVRGEDLPGFNGSTDIAADEIAASATAAADLELWWCRAVAKREELSVPFMDWYWHNRPGYVPPTE